MKNILMLATALLTVGSFAHASPKPVPVASLPAYQEFLDAAIVNGGLSCANVNGYQLPQAIVHEAQSMTVDDGR